MIRRWSYLNKLNRLTRQAESRYIEGQSDHLMNTFMWLHNQEFPTTSYVFRTSWARRRHAHNWLYITNVMITWAREYRLYRNYHRMVGYQFFMRNSYLAANVFSLKTRLSDRFRSDSLAVNSSLNHKVITFFIKRLGPTRLSLLLVFPALTLNYASFLAPYDYELESFKKIPQFPVLQPESNGTFVALRENNRTSTKTLLSILELINSYVNSITITYYSILIKLLLRTILLFCFYVNYQSPQTPLATY